MRRLATMALCLTLLVSGCATTQMAPVTFWGDEAGKVAPSDQQALSTYFKEGGES